MNDWAFWPVFVATVLSVVGWSYFLWREHEGGSPAALSNFAPRSQKNTVYYRVCMLVNPALFAVTGIWYVMPRTSSVLLVVLWLTACTCCMLAGVFLPRDGREEIWHNIFAYTMGFAMLGLASSSVLVLPKLTSVAAIIAVSMAAVAIIGPRRRRHYIFYELAFIFLSHASMIIIALAAYNM